MPTYEFVSEFVTLLLPVKSQTPTRKTFDAEVADSQEVLHFLDEQGRQFQFAEHWTARELGHLCKLGLDAEQFRCVRLDGRIAAVATVWDQRTFKQTIIRGYSPWLALARPAINCFARLMGTPPLPPVGATVAQAFVSHLAVDPKKPAAFITLIQKAMEVVAGQGIEFLTLGFGANDPRLALLRSKFRFRKYLSCIYLVRWRDLGASLDELDERCLGLETALL
jgi:hypothetical protein